MTELLGTVFSNPVVSFIVLVGLVVFVHELGHFLVGKALGLRVDVFSIGIGPRAFGFRKWGTDFQVCMLPLGGHVTFYGGLPGEEVPPELVSQAITTTRVSNRMAVSIAGPGANFLLSIFVMSVLSAVGTPQVSSEISVIPGGAADGAGMRTGDLVLAMDGAPVSTWEDVNEIISRSPGVPLAIDVRRRTFFGQEKREKLVVTPREEESRSVWGDKMRVGRIGVTPFYASPRLAVPRDSPWERLGLRTGDVVVRLQGRSVRRLDEIAQAVGEFCATGEESLRVELQRPPVRGELHGLSSSLAQGDVASKTVFAVWERPDVCKVLGPLPSTDWMVDGWTKAAAKDNAWAQCGLREGDTLLRFGETGILASSAQIYLALERAAARGNGPVALDLQVLRWNGEVADLHCRVPARDAPDALGLTRPVVEFPVRFLTAGVPTESVTVRAKNPGDAVVRGVQSAWSQGALIATGLRKLVLGALPLSNLGGPIAMARVASDAAAGGVLVFAQMVSWMSINIGLFNLLPLPALDGGALALQCVEALYGRRISPRIQGWVQRAGILVILCLFALVFYNDLSRLFGG